MLLKKGTNFIPWNGTVPDSSLHPKLGNALLQASKADCLSAVALIIALSEERSPFDSRRLSEFSMPKGMDSSIDLEESDLLALLVAYEKARALRFETTEQAIGNPWTSF